MKRLKQAGFTITELLVVIVVSTVLLTAVSSFFMSMLENYSVNDARANVQAEVHEALDKLTDDIRLSASADQQNRYQDNNAPGAPADLLSWQSGANVVVLATAAEDTSGNIIFDDPARYLSYKNNVIYFVLNGTLYRRVLAAPVANNKEVTTCPAGQSGCKADQALLSHVTSFSLRYLDELDAEVVPDEARSVEARLTVTTTISGSSVSVDYVTRMVFRNV